MSLVRKLEQINRNKMYVFDNNLLSMICIHAEVPQVPGATQIIAAIDNIVSLHTIEINNYTITNETVNSLANILHHNTQLQELYLIGNCLQADDIIAKIFHSISTSSVYKNHITDDATSSFVASQTSTTSETNHETADSTATIKAISLHSIATSKKFSISTNNIIDKATCHISGVISNTGLQELDISGLKGTGTINIAVALQSIVTLTKLCICNNSITSEIANYIVVAISRNTKLQEFDISNNNLQTTGTIKIANSFQGIHALQKLNLSAVNTTNKAADNIAKAISNNNKHLQEFHICKNKLFKIGAIKIVKALQDVCNLRALYISDNEINFEAADDIATAIGHTNQLYELDVSNNKFQGEGIRKILKPLKDCVTLRKLYISNNSAIINDDIVKDIAVVVSCNTGLQEFSIGKNYLQASSATIIAKALQNISTLTKLYINENNITDEAANDIATVISHNIHLQELDIGTNVLCTAGGIIIAKALQHISTLTKLYINNNNITDEAANDIGIAISRNSDLQIIIFCSNKFHKETALRMASFASTQAKIIM